MLELVLGHRTDRVSLINLVKGVGDIKPYKVGYALPSPARWVTLYEGKSIFETSQSEKWEELIPTILQER